MSVFVPEVAYFTDTENICSSPQFCLSDFGCFIICWVISNFSFCGRHEVDFVSFFCPEGNGAAGSKTFIVRMGQHNQRLFLHKKEYTIHFLIFGGIILCMSNTEGSLSTPQLDANWYNRFVEYGSFQAYEYLDGDKAYREEQKNKFLS